MTATTNRINPRTAFAIAAFMGALPGTKSQVIAKSGLNHSTVAKLVKQFHGKTIRIAGWAPHPVRGPEIPVFDVGTEPDAPDTRKRLTRKQINKRYEKRIKGTDTFDRRRAKRSSYWFEQKAKSKPHTWASALFIKSKEGAAC
jgi:hypothetical protein